MRARGRSFPLVVAAPSGAGKTSLARALVERHEDIVFSVSATTRRARREERHGKDYRFVDDPDFDRLAAAGELLEWAVVHGRRYGTPRREVENAVGAGKVVVLDIDVQGARQVRAALAEAVLVFILPPSGEELVRRLTGRGSEAEAERRWRLENARQELPALPEFDYVIVNDDFEAAVAALEAIVTAERRRVARLADVDGLLGRLDAEIGSLLERSE